MKAGLVAACVLSMLSSQLFEIIQISPSIFIFMELMLFDILMQSWQHPREKLGKLVEGMRRVRMLLFLQITFMLINADEFIYIGIYERERKRLPVSENEFC